MAIDYDRLGEHLCAIDPPLASFASAQGYRVRPQLSEGRYPGRRIVQEGPLLRSIHIKMDLAPGGKHYEQFFADIPYTVWGGTWIDDREQSTRWLGPSIRIQAIPFSALLETLEIHLDYFDAYLSRVTAEYVKLCACKVQLSSSPLGTRR